MRTRSVAVRIEDGDTQWTIECVADNEFEVVEDDGVQVVRLDTDPETGKEWEADCTWQSVPTQVKHRAYEAFLAGGLSPDDLFELDEDMQQERINVPG